ncbi:MAG TPA: GNAT family N-acetyltransferase [Blastocatellia bacterium]|nr:GNAT family N-acetyltransferase [Blastocatellia bacterium]
MIIKDLLADDEDSIRQAAKMLVEGFRENWPEAWPDLDSALEEVRQSFAPDRISRAAAEESGEVVGWVGGISMYEGKVWELHPLVVSRKARGRSVGRALVEDLEARVRERGGLTLWLGTDDENGMTSLYGKDLYPNVLEHLAGIRNVRNHPFEFYLKMGFVIVGVMPDANGPGKPDIYMAKRVGGVAGPAPVP